MAKLVTIKNLNGTEHTFDLNKVIAITFEPTTAKIVVRFDFGNTMDFQNESNLYEQMLELWRA